jgi:hypothetical protein
VGGPGGGLGGDPEGRVRRDRRRARDRRERDRWLEGFLMRWAPRGGMFLVVTGAAALVVGWCHGGVL